MRKRTVDQNLSNRQSKSDRHWGLDALLLAWNQAQLVITHGLSLSLLADFPDLLLITRADGAYSLLPVAG